MDRHWNEQFSGQSHDFNYAGTLTQSSNNETTTVRFTCILFNCCAFYQNSFNVLIKCINIFLSEEHFLRWDREAVPAMTVLARL